MTRLSCVIDLVQPNRFGMSGPLVRLAYLRTGGALDLGPSNNFEVTLTEYLASASNVLMLC